VVPPRGTASIVAFAAAMSEDSASVSGSMMFDYGVLAMKSL